MGESGRIIWVGPSLSRLKGGAAIKGKRAKIRVLHCRPHPQARRLIISELTQVGTQKDQLGRALKSPKC